MIRYLILFSASMLLLVPLKAQQTLTQSFMHGGVMREYILYVPASYDPNVETPVVFNFHGYGSNASDQMWYADFRGIADTATFLVVHPEGTVFQGSTHWNVGGWINGSPTDDVGFTNAMIDTLIANYNVDQTRIYSTGMSNGGFMSFLLACQLSHRIAAVASVTGSMTPETYNNCNPQHPTPVLQVHSLQDGVVPYIGAVWTRSVVDALDYWVSFNGCGTTPNYATVPDINLLDACTAEHFVYTGGVQNSTVEHYRITGGGHTWPGSFFGGAGTNQDFDASQEIWRFFSQYTLTGLQVAQDQPIETAVTVYPNPTQGNVRIGGLTDLDTPFRVLDGTGRVVLSGQLALSENQIDLGRFADGLYFLEVNGQVFKVLKSE